MKRSYGAPLILMSEKYESVEKHEIFLPFNVAVRAAAFLVTVFLRSHHLLATAIERSDIPAKAVPLSAPAFSSASLENSASLCFCH